MKSSDIDTTSAISTFVAPVILIALIVAFTHATIWHKRNNSLLGFKWGFFIIYSTMLTYLTFSGFLSAGFINSGEIGKAGTATIGIFIASIALFVLSLRRNRWAIIIVTILSLTPIIWIINIFYIKNRWQEFKLQAK